MRWLCCVHVTADGRTEESREHTKPMLCNDDVDSLYRDTQIIAIQAIRTMVKRVFTTRQLCYNVGT